MEIKITTNQILKVLCVLSWIIFIGLCVEAGALIVNTVITVFINPSGVQNFWEASDYLSNLYALDKGHFCVLTSLMIIVSVLKALMFYVILNMFYNKKLNIIQPFSNELAKFILNLFYLALGIGLFSRYAMKYTIWLQEQGAGMADLQALDIAGADVWLFMAIIFFLIVQLVKKGIEIQNENDLTI